MSINTTIVVYEDDVTVTATAQDLEALGVGTDIIAKADRVYFCPRDAINYGVLTAPTATAGFYVGATGTGNVLGQYNASLLRFIRDTSASGDVSMRLYIESTKG